MCYPLRIGVDRIARSDVFIPVITIQLGTAEDSPSRFNLNSWEDTNPLRLRPLPFCSDGRAGVSVMFG